MSQSDNINSYLIQLEALDGQYRTKLTEYESAYTTYISTLQDQTQSSATNSYVVLPGHTYTGTSTISNNTNSSISQCEALCSADSACTGASFNSTSAVCSLKSGNSGLTAGATSDNAIITNIKSQIIHLETLNAQLIAINEQITEIYSKIQPLISGDSTSLSANGEDITAQYSTLLAEKMKIKRLLEEYNDIDKNYIDQSLTVEQQNATYYLWIAICIIVFVITIQMIVFPDASIGKSIIIIMFIAFLIFSTMYLTNPSIYALWLVVIAIIVMVSFKLY